MTLYFACQRFTCSGCSRGFCAAQKRRLLRAASLQEKATRYFGVTKQPDRWRIRTQMATVTGRFLTTIRRRVMRGVRTLFQWKYGLPLWAILWTLCWTRLGVVSPTTTLDLGLGEHFPSGRNSLQIERTTGMSSQHTKNRKSANPLVTVGLASRCSDFRDVARSCLKYPLWSPAIRATASDVRPWDVSVCDIGSANRSLRPRCCRRSQRPTA